MKIQAVNNNYKPLNINRNYPYFTGKDLMNMPRDEVFKEIKNSINKDQFVGSGRHAAVYRISDTPYCVRIPDICEDGYTNDFSTNLNPCDIVNHVKIKLGAGASIMDYFKGRTLFAYQLYDVQRYELQKEVAKMPLKTYSNLLHQLANAIDNEMAFDKGGGNIVIDTENKNLTIIDFYQLADNPLKTSPLKDLFYTLTSYGAESTTAKKIAKNIISAGLEEFKPNIIPCMDVELFDFKEIIDATYYFKQPKSDEELNELIKKFEELKEIKKKEITDKNYSPILEQKTENLKKSVSKYLR